MTNQWGRDGNATGGGTKSGSVILPILVSLILGIAAGYGGFRFLGGDAGSEIASRDKRIVELEKTISDLRFDDGAANQQQTVLTADIDDLKQRLEDARSEMDVLKKANQSLASDQDASQNQQLEEARREIEALHQTLAEAGDLRNDLTRANKSLRISELQIIDLEKIVNNQNKKLAALEKELGDRSNSADETATARIAALGDENAALRSELASQKKQAADGRKILEDSIAALSLRVSQTEKKLSAAQSAQSLALADLTKANAARDQLAARRQKLEDENTGLKQSLADSLATAAKLKAQNKDLTDQINGLNAKVKSLRDDISALKAAAEKLKDVPAEPQGDKPKEETGQTEGPALTVRNVDDVTNALARMPNFDRLNAQKQALLKEKLMEGACVTDALEAVFERVPVIALRNLIRDLKSPC